MINSASVIVKTNYYEDLIDEEMIDLVADGNANISEYIRKLSQNEQRLRILSILDKDRGLFMNIKKIIEGEYIPKCEHIQNVVTMMREYVQVSETEKKKFGEVMTPIWLVEEMLNKLPEEVWSNPHLKWLDPANGVGVFPSVIVNRLMIGLQGFIEDDEQRYKHIVENMLYVCELQKKNMFLFLTTFDPKDEYLLNIFTGSFLSKEFDEHCKNVWGVEKFDIVVGNPPYQDAENVRSPLWQKFVLKTREMISECGDILFIHPGNWRKPKHELLSVFKNMNLVFLSIHSSKDGMSTFNCSTRYDWYHLRNEKYSGVTEVVDQDGKTYNLDISNLPFIPNGMFDEIFSLLAKDGEERVDVLHSYSAYETRKPHMSPVQTDEFTFPCVHATRSKDVVVWYSNTNKNGHFGIPKVIVGMGNAKNPFLDEIGKYGTTQDCFSIANCDLNKINIALSSKSFHSLVPYLIWSGFKFDRDIFSEFKADFWKEIK